MKRYCLALDLVNDPLLIAEYEYWHKDGNGWPEIKSSILDAGIQDMQIFLIGNRLFMIIETDDSFSFERKAEMDTSNPMVQKWEKLMEKFQKPLPWANGNGKWVLMNKIYQL